MGFFDFLGKVIFNKKFYLFFLISVIFIIIFFLVYIYYIKEPKSYISYGTCSYECDFNTGGCNEDDYPTECLYKSKGEAIHKIIKRDKTESNLEDIGGCKQTVRYIYCD